jgi:SNF2 family DNA or RNA helicase
MELLVNILENILANDEKVIIFTQYVEMGKLIQELISKKI